MKGKSNRTTYIVKESYKIPDHEKRNQIVAKKLACMIIMDKNVHKGM